MKSTVAAATAMLFAVVATTASAGVVVSRETVVGTQPGGRKSTQTLMIQGHKQRLIDPDRDTITDLDAKKTYVLDTKDKKFLEIPFPPVNGFQRMITRQTLAIALTKAAGTNKVAGYSCQDYTGSVPVAQSTLSVTECVASDAPGAKEFVDYQKALAQTAKGTPLAPKGEIPDGIPVSSVSTRKVNPFPHLPGATAEQMAKLNAAMAKNKPFVTSVTVSKIETKDIPADTFVVPADYTKVKEPTPAMPGMHPVTPGGATMGSAPTAPAAKPAAPATH